VAVFEIVIIRRMGEIIVTNQFIYISAKATCRYFLFPRWLKPTAMISIDDYFGVEWIIAVPFMGRAEWEVCKGFSPNCYCSFLPTIIICGLKANKD
jgi:hypothetical protein